MVSVSNNKVYFIHREISTPLCPQNIENVNDYVCVLKFSDKILLYFSYIVVLVFMREKVFFFLFFFFNSYFLLILLILFVHSHPHKHARVYNLSACWKTTGCCLLTRIVCINKYELVLIILRRESDILLHLRHLFLSSDDDVRAV